MTSARLWQLQVMCQWLWHRPYDDTEYWQHGFSGPLTKGTDSRAMPGCGACCRP